MHQQKLSNPKLSALKGIGVVLGLVAGILIVSIGTELLIPLIGSMASSILFWGLGALLALWTMRRFVLSYTYLLDSNLLRISFAYGRYERNMADLYFNNIVSAGTLEDMRARYPGARVHRALRAANPTPVLALACRDDGATAIFLLQPDEVIREKLEETARKNRK